MLIGHLLLFLQYKLFLNLLQQLYDPSKIQTLENFLFGELYIFVFHFISLFLMPLMFVQQNLEAFFKFTMKIFITMVEIPIFVLSVWVALSANSLLHTIGDIFGKKMIAYIGATGQ